jgi:cell wall-associated NlpC family hydrolase
MTRLVCTQSAAPLWQSPDAHAEPDNQILYGETVTVLSRRGRYLHVRTVHDGYEGWVAAAGFAADTHPATHWVTAFAAHLYARPDLKSPVRASLPFLARLACAPGDNGFLQTPGGYVFARHVAPLDAVADDYVTVAERFTGVPYLWGGRSCFGIDCSGLVQTALAACGRASPRNSRDQVQALGVTLAIPPALQGLARGDFVFWKGHVGIMTDPVTLLHANAFHMTVAREPLAKTVARYSAAGLGITAVRRLQ